MRWIIKFLVSFSLSATAMANPSSAEMHHTLRSTFPQVTPGVWSTLKGPDCKVEIFIPEDSNTLPTMYAYVCKADFQRCLTHVDMRFIGTSDFCRMEAPHQAYCPGIDCETHGCMIPPRWLIVSGKTLTIGSQGDTCDIID